MPSLQDIVCDSHKLDGHQEREREPDRENMQSYLRETYIGIFMCVYVLASSFNNKHGIGLFLYC